MKHVRRLLPVLLWAVCACASVVGQITPAHLVNQLTVAQYRDTLDNRLYTRTGHNRGFGAEHDLARQFLYSSYQSFDLDVRLHPFTYNSNEYYNVVAVLPGLVSPNEQVIMCGHYDSVNNPGADDNASGTAAVLETARVLSNYRFEKTIVFIAFDREEQGLVGSTAYANQYRNDNIIGVVNLDMVAYNPSGNQANIYGRTASNPIKQGLASALTRYSGIQAVVNGALDRSDHAPFESIGKQACLLIERSWSSNPNYHRQTDTVDTQGYINYDYAVLLTKGAAGFVAEQAVLLPTFLPDGYTILQGYHAGGGAPELVNSDDQYLRVGAVRPFELNFPSASFETWTQAATQTPSRILLQVETNVSAVPALQVIQLYDYQAGQWTTVDSRFATLTDNKLTLDIQDSPAKFVEPGTRRVKAKIGATDWGITVVAWSLNVDRVNWVVR